MPFSIMFRLLDLPVDILLVIFEQYFEISPLGFF
jgi:hypothetical protein